MRPKPPCLNCEDRQIGCHAVCEKYIQFRKELDEVNRLAYENERGPFLADGFLATQCAKKRKP